MTRSPAVPALLITVLLSLPAASQNQLPHREAADVAPLLPNAPARQAEVSSEAAEWQSSGVLVRAGDSYLVTASGQWKLAAVCPPTGPDGVGLYTLLCWDIGGQTLPGASHGLLIGKVGHNGQPFAVGSSLDMLADSTGVLYLMANDAVDWFSDNNGRMRVTVRLLDTAAVPVAQPASVQPAEVKRGGGGGGRAPQQ